ncbi:MAG: fumarylacetoacetase [Acidimicrobiaceae bacterium]|nr:fumarylacetoacetase [Acidimicrobiaceae bacterium]
MADESGSTWVPVDEGSPFPISNLPYGVFSVGGGPARVGVAIGSSVVDLAALAGTGLLPGLDGAFAQPSLNRFMAHGPRAWAVVRERLTTLLRQPQRQAAMARALHPLDSVRLRLPIEVADFVDFYSSLDHATNMGHMLRPEGPALPPAWRHLPIGYHGRAGTVVVSGAPLLRPWGQVGEREFRPTAKLDFEAEVAFVVGAGSRRGHPVTAASLAEHAFGVVLVNDWSARDIQSWEYQPLGPFLGKSFATSISPWVVPLEALRGARVAAPAQDPPPLAYLHDAEPWSLDLTLEVRLNGEVIARPPFAGTYWTPGQHLAHLTANGASLRTGDLLASGTVSGREPGQRGSLMELGWNGTAPLTLADGTTRAWLHDGDTVSISGWAPGADGTRIGWGEVSGTIHPAHPAHPADPALPAHPADPAHPGHPGPGTP